MSVSSAKESKRCEEEWRRGRCRRREKSLTVLVKLADKQCNETVRQVVSKGTQSLAHFVSVDTAGAIAVECLEAALPVFNVFPQSCKLLEIDGSGTVYVGGKVCIVSFLLAQSRLFRVC